ncbi:hypothetical protein PTKIN_Ptkin16aG0100900 [Pterospermum kingtungense]
MAKTVRMILKEYLIRQDQGVLSDILLILRLKTMRRKENRGISSRNGAIAHQLELVESYQLAAENSGAELNPSLQILLRRLNKSYHPNPSKTSTTVKNETRLKALTDNNAGTSANRLPLLPLSKFDKISKIVA